MFKIKGQESKSSSSASFLIQEVGPDFFSLILLSGSEVMMKVHRKKLWREEKCVFHKIPHWPAPNILGWR